MKLPLDAGLPEGGGLVRAAAAAAWDSSIALTPSDLSTARTPDITGVTRTRLPIDGLALDGAVELPGAVGRQIGLGVADHTVRTSVVAD